MDNESDVKTNKPSGDSQPTPEKAREDALREKLDFGDEKESAEPAQEAFPEITDSESHFESDDSLEGEGPFEDPLAGDEGSEEHPPIDAAAQTAALGSVVVSDDAPSDVPDVDVS